jgi:hypothetical protein
VALVGSGIVRTVALVGCGKLKKPQTWPPEAARDLYIGSLFKLSFRHAQAAADDVHILSALHGLVDPSTRLEPYDYSMAQMFVSAQRAWGVRVLTELKAAYPLTPLRIIFYAGQHYIRPIMEAVTVETSYWTFKNPLEGMDLFERLRWLKQQSGELDQGATA